MSKIEIPTKCPACDSELEMVNDQLYCRSSTCPAKSLKGLTHFVKTMKIMGLGEQTLKKLETNTINDLYDYTLEDLVDKLGEKIGTKILNEIDKSKNTTLQKFISAQGIPLIGKTAAEKIQNSGLSIEDIDATNCKKAGLGEKATANLVNWVNNEYYKYADLPFEFADAEPLESGIAVCISGKIPGYTKSQIREMLMDYNVTVKDSVTKDLNYLISNETGTTKIKKAKGYNIEVLSFSEFMEKIK